MKSIKKQLLSAINTVVPLDDYAQEDYVFSQKYGISSTAMVYILQKLAKDLNFTITEEFIDAMEMCTFSQLEELLERYSGTALPSETAGQASSDAE